MKANTPLIILILFTFFFKIQSVDAQTEITVNGSSSFVNVPNNNANGATATVSFNSIPNDATLTNIEVSLGVNHEWVGDLKMELIAPTGNSIVLVNRPARIFPDETVYIASNLISTHPINFSDTFTNDPKLMGALLFSGDYICLDNGVCDYYPNNEACTRKTFADLINEVNAGSGPQGNWQVKISDLNDSGTVGNFKIDDLSLTYIVTEQNTISRGNGLLVNIPDNNSTGATAIVPFNDIPNGATLTNVEVSLGINHDWAGDLKMELISPSNHSIVLVNRPARIFPDETVYDSSTLNSNFEINFSDAYTNDAKLMGSTIGSSSIICSDDGICDYYPNDDACDRNTFFDLINEVNAGSGAQGNWKVTISDLDGGNAGNFIVSAISLTYEYDNPIANCQPATFTLNDNGEITIDPSDIDNGSSTVGSISLSLNKTFFDCSDIGENTVTLTVTDINGFTDTCETIVTILAPTVSTLTCPEDIIAYAPAGGTIVVNYEAPTITGCLSSWTQTSGFASGDAVAPGNYTNTFEGETSDGSTVTCSFNVTINEIDLSVYGDPFITKWRVVENENDITDRSILIPTIGNGYEFYIDWGDGTSLEYHDNGNIYPTHIYQTDGDYIIKIFGDFPRIKTSQNSTTFDYALRLLEVMQWGDTQWSTMEHAFRGSEYLDVTATDAPDLSNATSLERMFDFCVSLVGNEYINDWNVETIENFIGVFFACADFNQPLNDWDVSNATDMGSMFHTCGDFDQPLNNWDVSNVTEMNLMFAASGMSNSVGMWDISSLENASGMFSSTNISTALYDDILFGWATLDTAAGETQIPSDISISFLEATYCAAHAEHDLLDNDFNWTFTDGGIESSDCLIICPDIQPVCPEDITFNLEPGITAEVTYEVTIPNCVVEVPDGYSFLGVWENRSYLISNDLITTSDVFNEAESLNGFAATITSQAHNDFIRTAADNSGFSDAALIIGYNDIDVEDTFEWHSGSTASYTNWNSNEPNNSGGDEDYTMMLVDGKWNDTHGNVQGHYILELTSPVLIQTAGLASGSTFPEGETTNIFEVTATDGSENVATCSFIVDVNPECTAPTFTHTSTVNCDNYSVGIDITDIGIGDAFVFSDNQGGASQTANGTGLLIFGPYLGSTEVIINYSNGNTFCDGEIIYEVITTDTDGDGICDTDDQEVNSPCPDDIDENGVSNDDDNDGIANCEDFCDNTIDANNNGIPECEETYIIYVNQSAALLGDGVSWDTAFIYLQDALDLASNVVNDYADIEIWVANGVYYPDDAENVTIDDNSVEATFQLINRVSLLGGFVGAETSNDLRDPEANITILSGDIDQNDTNGDGNYIAEHYTDTSGGTNSINIVTGSGVDNSAFIDGFTITAGYANQGNSPANTGGGGMLNNSGSPSVHQIKFVGNYGKNRGGAMNNVNGAAPIINEVIFLNNHCQEEGGAICNYNNSAPIIFNSKFLGNYAQFGGTMYNRESSPILTNCIVSGNNAFNTAGFFNRNSSDVEFYNVSFYNNTSDFPTTASVMFNILSSKPKIRNCIFYNNISNGSLENTLIYSGTSAGPSTISYTYFDDPPSLAIDGNTNEGINGNIIDSTNPFINPNGEDEVAGTVDDNLQLANSTAAIDSGNNSVNAEATDLAGNPRFYDDSYINDLGQGSAPIIDMGAYEKQTNSCESDPNNDGICDYEDPIAICQNLTFAINPGEFVQVSPSQIDNGSSDNEQIGVYLLNDEPNELIFEYDDLGDNEVTLTVLDLSGNIAQCNATITITSNATLPILISEYQPELQNEGDPTQTIEIFGGAGEIFGGAITIIEGDVDSGQSGLILNSYPISGTFDTNGLLTVTVPNLTGPSHTIVLSSSFSGTIGTTNIDENDDGIAENISSLGIIFDAISVVDENLDINRRYANQLGGTNLPNIDDRPHSVFRETSTGDFFLLDINGTIFDNTGNTILESIFDTLPSVNGTFGEINPSSIGNSPNPFVTIWETTTDAESITIPTEGDGYDYTVHWGDGTIESGFTTDATHTYTTAGTYTVSIIGDFPRIFFNNSGDKSKITEVKQWGHVEWTSMESAFYGCNNLHITANDAPDLSSVTSMKSMFRNNTAIDEDISHWDVSNVEDMAFLFRECVNFNSDISSWNVSSVNSFATMFNGASQFNQDLSTWDVSNATQIRSMFNGASQFNQDLSTWDISNVTDANNIFSNTSLSTENYDAILIGWSTLDTSAGETAIPNGILFGAENIKYCLSETERTLLMTPVVDGGYGWTISDAGLDASCSPVVNLSPKVYLQGASLNPNTGEESLMRDDLRVADPILIPLTSPYGDAAIVEASVLTAVGADAIVDWVWVELRDKDDNTIIIDSQSALLQRDGDVVAVDGISPLTFDQSSDDYYVTINHRNHVGIISSSSVSLSSAATLVDLSSDPNMVEEGLNAIVLLANGSYGMYTGDYNPDGQIQNTDANDAIQQIGISGYNLADMDVNSQVQNTDVNLVLIPNIGVGQQFSRSSVGVMSSQNAPDMTLSFANAQITNDGVDDYYYEADIMIASTGSFYAGSGQIYIEYNPAAFGENISGNGGLDYGRPESSILGQTFFDGAVTGYSDFIEQDNTNSRVSVSFQQNTTLSVLETESGFEVTNIPKQLLHLKIKYQDVNEDAGICFYYDNGLFQDQFITACGGSGSIDCVNAAGQQITSDSYDCTEAEVSALGLTDQDIANLVLYPNPAKTNFYIKGLKAESTIKVYDLNGRLITQQQIVENQAIDMSRYEDGVYLVEITSGTNTIIKRLIKKH